MSLFDFQSTKMVIFVNFSRFIDTFWVEYLLSSSVDHSQKPLPLLLSGPSLFFISIFHILSLVSFSSVWRTIPEGNTSSSILWISRTSQLQPLSWTPCIHPLSAFLKLTHHFPLNTCCLLWFSDPSDGLFFSLSLLS